MFKIVFVFSIFLVCLFADSNTTILNDTNKTKVLNEELKQKILEVKRKKINKYIEDLKLLEQQISQEQVWMKSY